MSTTSSAVVSTTATSLLPPALREQFEKKSIAIYLIASILATAMFWIGLLILLLVNIFKKGFVKGVLYSIAFLLMVFTVSAVFTIPTYYLLQVFDLTQYIYISIYIVNILSYLMMWVIMI